MVSLCCLWMSELCWTAHNTGGPTGGRTTAKKLGECAKQAVVRWGAKYRVICMGKPFEHRLRAGLPARVRSVCHVFGVAEEFLLAERVCPGVVTVLRNGREFECETWVLRGERTLPPLGPRACATPDLCALVGMTSDWRTQFDWSALAPTSGMPCHRGIAYLRRHAKRVRILSLRRHDGVYAYRAVYWHAPKEGQVRIQGLSGVGVILPAGLPGSKTKKGTKGTKGMCEVMMKNCVFTVHRTCLVQV